MQASDYSQYENQSILLIQLINQ